MNRVVSGDIYTAGKNFTLPLAVTALTNFTVGSDHDDNDVGKRGAAPIVSQSSGETTSRGSFHVIGSLPTICDHCDFYARATFCGKLGTYLDFA